MSKIIRVNMADKEVAIESVPEKYEMLGGRSLTAQMLIDEVNPECEALGAFNKLVIAPGLLGGTRVSTSGRVSVGGKSPLTGGIKEANTGGTVGRQLIKLGIKALVLEGKVKKDDWNVLVINPEKVLLESAEYLIGKGNYEVMETLRAKYGEKIGMITIGQAGEMMLPASALCFSDMDGLPNRQAARGGLGAVLGSKGIKAIIFDDAGSNEGIVDLVDEKGFNEIAKGLNKDLAGKKALTDFGTAFLVKPTNAIGALPVRNFSKGSFDKWENISGERMAQLNIERGGKPSHPCQPGCVIRCSNVFHDAEGKYVVSSIEYETIGLFGSNIDNDSLDAIARMNRLCNDFGVDTIDVGCALGVAAEAGLFEWGDAAAAENLVAEIGKGTILGRMLGSGATITGKLLGVTRVPAVKGQSFAAYDPRPLKGTGTTYATTPMGADHTAGNLILGREGVDATKPEGQKRASHDIQIYAAVLDGMGFCNFVGGARPIMEIIAQLMTKAYGKEYTTEDIIEFGKNILRNELKFNRAAGLTKADDCMPEFVKTEPLEPTGLVYDVPDEDLHSLFEDIEQ